MNVGGQAVIEGVMIRNKEKMAIAVRLPNGKIKIKKESSTKLPKIFDFFFIRGMVGLAYVLVDGIKALSWSSDQQLGKEEKLTTLQLFFTFALAMIIALVFFVAVPFFTAKFLSSSNLWFNLLDGLFRVIILVVYMWAISQMKDVRRVFQYHGAEHKAIACYEQKKALTVANVQKCSRFHPRCGTSFLFLVILISIAVFSFIPGGWMLKLLGRIVLVPFIAGISYELIRASAEHQKNFFWRMVIAPGLWLQRITTQEPSKKQMEVGICALKAVLE